MFLPYPTNSNDITNSILQYWNYVVDSFYYKKHTFKTIKHRQKLLLKNRAYKDGKIIHLLK